MKSKSTGARRVLIYGGLGYLGTRLAEVLSHEYSVVITSRTLSDVRKKWLSAHPEIKHQIVTPSQNPHFPIEGTFDCAINLAMPNATECTQDKERALQSSEQTLRSLIDGIRQGRIGRLIHFSSFHVYGKHPQTIYHETDELHPLHPYGEIHKKIEEHLQACVASVPIFVARATNVVGAPGHPELGAQSNLIFFDCCAQAVRQKAVRLKGDGKGYRDFLPLADFLSAMQLLITLPTTSRTPQVMNLSSGHSRSLANLADLVKDQAQASLGEDIPLEFGSLRDAYERPFAVDNARLKQAGWNPRGDLGQEIQQIISFFKKAA